MTSDDCNPAEAALLREIPDRSQRASAVGVSNVLESVRRARANADATAAVVRKLRGSPLAWLAARGGIRGEEVRAADDIALAFLAGPPALGLRSTQSLDRVDLNGSGDVADARRRYGAFARHWSQRAKRGDPTLSVLVAIVVDHQPFEAIEEEIGIRPGKAAEAVVAGLRDYAARAGWVDERLAQKWIRDAAATFAPATGG